MTAVDEPRWPEGTVLAWGDDDGLGYVVDGRGEPIGFNGKPTRRPLDSPHWWVVGQLIPDGCRAVPDEMCVELAQADRARANAASQTGGSAQVGFLRRRADILDPPAAEPPGECVTLDAGNGGTWEPTQEDVDTMISYLSAGHSHPNVLCQKADQVADVYTQLAEGKELRSAARWPVGKRVFSHPDGPATPADQTPQQ